jgi:hypothetical protein
VPDCGVRVEAVPWARGVRFTRDFEDVVAYLAQQMAKAPIARLMRIAWDTVGEIVERVIAERLDSRRLDGLRMVGVDEVSYRKRHRYLTVVADHHSGRIVWVAKGRNAATLQPFFDEFGPRRATLRAVSIDMSGGYETTRSRTPRSRRRTSTPGSAGPPAAGSRRSSRPPGPCAATAPASSPRSASGCPTAASKGSTAASGSPQLRLPLRRPADRPHLPLLRPHHHRPTAPMTATQTLEAPRITQIA